MDFVAISEHFPFPNREIETLSRLMDDTEWINKRFGRAMDKDAYLMLMLNLALKSNQPE